MLAYSSRFPLGAVAPEFNLPDFDGKMWSLRDFGGAKALVVAFICNHCPYVRHVAEGLARFAQDCAPRGAAVVAISASDVQSYPDDSPEKMRDFAARFGFPFPYLYDETQQVALTYEAACTPDFYVFDDARRLIYHGEFDPSRPKGGIPVTGASIRAALDATLNGKPVPGNQIPSMGCSTKWKPGNEPDWAA